jgi:hypothetical protein
VFTSVSVPLQFLTCLNPLGRFAMWTAFPPSDYYRPSAPPPGHRRTTHLPRCTHQAGRGSREPTGWFPRSPRTVRQVRWPALPLRHRHGYAAVLHRGLPTGETNPIQEFPARHEGPVRAANQPISTGFELAKVLRGFTPLVPRVHLPVSLAGPAPSGSTGASRRCQGCSPSAPVVSPKPTAPSSYRLAATRRRQRSYTLARSRGASWRTVSHLHSMPRTSWRTNP